jgi:hypothetical protein
MGGTFRDRIIDAVVRVAETTRGLVDLQQEQHVADLRTRTQGMHPVPKSTPWQLAAVMCRP